MPSNIIDRLFASFSELEQAIVGARETLAKKQIAPKDIFERLQSYDGILAKQRHLALALREHMNNGNWDEVSRHVSLINGLSAMIRDDARTILNSLKLNSDECEKDDIVNFC